MWIVIAIVVLVIMLLIVMYHCVNRGDSTVVAAILELVVDVLSAIA
jgi:hypothetical protein